MIEEDYNLGQYTHLAEKVCTYNQFVDFEITEEIMDLLSTRMKNQAPGHCCSLVYTSGTTGNPKGVMLSHDNYTWTANSVAEHLVFDEPSPRLVSFLPLSHVAAQYSDIVLQLASGYHIFFADISALRGKLIDYLLEVRPNVVLAVPRLYEKMEEKARAALEEKPTIFRWASGVSFLSDS